jgi:hypothetical protein
LFIRADWADRIANGTIRVARVLFFDDDAGRGARAGSLLRFLFGITGLGGGRFGFIGVV